MFLHSFWSEFKCINTRKRMKNTVLKQVFWQLFCDICSGCTAHGEVRNLRTLMERSAIHTRVYRPCSQRRCCHQGEAPAAPGGICPLHPGEGLHLGVSATSLCLQDWAHPLWNQTALACGISFWLQTGSKWSGRTSSRFLPKTVAEHRTYVHFLQHPSDSKKVLTEFSFHTPDDSFLHNYKV